MRVLRQLDGAIPSLGTIFKEAFKECLVMIAFDILFSVSVFAFS